MSLGVIFDGYEMSEAPAADRIPIIARAIESAYAEVVARARRSRERGRNDLGAFDPLDAGWCPFELAGATSEPHWTQWLAGLLRGPDEATRDTVWQAIAAISLREAAKTGAPVTENVLLQRVVPESVHAERADAVALADGSGAVGIRPDIVIEDDDRVVVLELKLWGRWNPFSAEENQATHYARHARERANQRAHGVDAEKPEVVLINLSIDRCPSPGWVAITWEELARELRGSLREMVTKQGHVPARAFPLYALVAGIERTLLDLAENSADPPAVRHARAHRLLRHFPSPPEERGSTMSSALFSDVSREVAAHYTTLCAAYEEFEGRRSELTTHLLGVALGVARGGGAARPIPAPDLQKVEGGGTLYGAYWKTPCCARAGDLGARGQHAGFWLGFCSGHHYADTDTDDVLANDLVFRADLWFPLPASNRAAFERVAAEQCVPRRTLVEGAHVCIPVLRVRALDADRSVLEEQVAGLYDRFMQVDEILLATLRPRAASADPSSRRQEEH